MTFNFLIAGIQNVLLLLAVVKELSSPIFMLFFHNFVAVFISISLLKQKLFFKDIKIILISTQYYNMKLTSLCIKMFDQLKVSTTPKITLLCTAFTVINVVMNVIANLSCRSVSNSTFVG